jgi:hypothetical protein
MVNEIGSLMQYTSIIIGVLIIVCVIGILYSKSWKGKGFWVTALLLVLTSSFRLAGSFLDASSSADFDVTKQASLVDLFDKFYIITLMLFVASLILYSIALVWLNFIEFFWSVPLWKRKWRRERRTWDY